MQQYGVEQQIRAEGRDQSCQSLEEIRRPADSCKYQLDIAAGEVLVVRDPDIQRLRALALIDDPQSEGFPIVITRNKWDANEMELAVGDAVVIGLKGYRLLPHYPL
jgi:hypothetical protein